MKRRDFLKQGLTIGVAANALPLMLGGFSIKALGRSPLRSALETQGGTNNNVLVIIQLAGGNDGLNCVVPYSNPLYKTMRPTLGLDKTADGLLVLPDHDTLAFHGGMDGMLGMYNAGKLALLQNVGYPAPILSHFRGTDIWNTATDSGIYSTTGWVGRVLNDLNPGYPPSVIPAGSQPLAIQFGSSLSNLFLGQNGGMGIAINKLPTTDNPSTHFYDALPANLTNPYKELGYVRSIQEEGEVYSTSLVKRSVNTNKVDYTTLAPNNTLATQLSYVAQVIASGFTTKIFLVTLGGFDTHSNQLTDQATLLKQLSEATSAFQQDLEAFGVADKVVTMTYSEFGRRPLENGSGTDHGTAAPHFVFGTQVKGKVYGADPNLAATALVSGNLAYETDHDFRNVYATMLNEWLLGGSTTDNMTEINNVLSASNGHTYSTTNTWTSLGIIKPQAGVATGQPSSIGLMLMQNYPNPFVASTTIEYALPERTAVELSIWNTAGEEVARIVDGTQSSGVHSAEFASGRLPSGSYIYRLKTPTTQVTKQMVIVK
jgi:uncharacterized protein (DUF1501 family)